MFITCILRSQFTTFFIFFARVSTYILCSVYLALMHITNKFLKGPFFFSSSSSMLLLNSLNFSISSMAIILTLKTTLAHQLSMTLETIFTLPQIECCSIFFQPFKKILRLLINKIFSLTPNKRFKRKKKHLKSCKFQDSHLLS